LCGEKDREKMIIWSLFSSRRFVGGDNNKVDKYQANCALGFDKQEMHDTMDSTTLSWKQLRRTLQRSGGGEEGNDEAKGMPIDR
jgi:hypothetical protein